MIFWQQRNPLLKYSLPPAVNKKQTITLYPEIRIFFGLFGRQGKPDELVAIVVVGKKF